MTLITRNKSCAFCLCIFLVALFSTTPGRTWSAVLDHCLSDQPSDVDQPTPSAQLLANPASAAVIHQLTEPAAQRRQALERALHTLLRQSPLPGQQVLVDKARLVAAALAIQDGDMRIARNHLRHIQLDSPAAVEAALLMAESWRRENNNEAALQWYLRTHDYFPHDAKALGALLGAAAILHDEDMHGDALTLYRRLYTSAMASLVQIDALEEKLLTDGIDIILTSQQKIDPALQRAIAAHALRAGSADILEASEERPAAAQQLQCVLHAYVALSHQQQALEERLSPLREQADQLLETIGQRQAHVEQLRTMLDTGAHPPEDRDSIRRAITEERNILLQERARHQALATNLDTLPEAFSASLQSLATLIAHHADGHLHHNTVIESGLRQAIALHRRLLMESAGHSQTGIARLHDPGVSEY